MAFAGLAWSTRGQIQEKGTSKPGHSSQMGGRTQHHGGMSLRTKGCPSPSTPCLSLSEDPSHTTRDPTKSGRERKPVQAKEHPTNTFTTTSAVTTLRDFCSLPLFVWPNYSKINLYLRNGVGASTPRYRAENGYWYQSSW